MSRTREILCIHYQCAHKCDLGKDANHYGLCQHCGLYKPKKGRKPARTDHRRQELDKAMKRDQRYDREDY